jgi:TolB-like protein
MWCDVVALRDAVQGGRYDEAIELARGELLEGFHVSNVGEGFETWLARERANAVALTLRALDANIERHSREGSGAVAAAVAMRASELAPFDEPRLRRAVTALEAAGDRGGALRLADAFVQRLATELEARPSADTRALIDRLRLSNTRPPGSRLGDTVWPSPAPQEQAATQSSAQPSAQVASPAPPGEPETPRSDAEAAPAPPPAQPAPRASLRSRLTVRTSLIAVGALIILGVFAIRAWSGSRPIGRQRVLVTQFENRTGDSTLDPLGDMEADWLTRGIVAVQLVDVVDPRALFARGRTRNGESANPQQLAHRTGAAYVITGSYYRSADSLLFFAGIIDADGRVLRSVGPIAATTARSADGVEAIRARIMTSLVSIIDPRSRARFEIDETPPAYEAYQPYIAGWDAFWLGQFRASESLFVLAGARDSAFDAAKVALATAAANVLDCVVVDSVSRALATRGKYLSELDRLGVGIAVARCHGRNDEMFKLAMLRAQLLSASSQWQVSTANAALWANHFADAAIILKRMNPDVDLDWLPRRDHLEYWESLTEDYHMLGQHDVEFAAASRSKLSGLGGLLCRGRALGGLGRAADAMSVLDSSFTMPSEPGLANGMLPNTDGRPEYTGSGAWVALWVARELTVHGDSVAGSAAARRAVTWIDALPRDDRAAPEMRAFKAEFLEQAGAFGAARQLVQGLIADDSSNVDYRGMMAGLAVESGDSALADRLDAWLAGLPPERAHWGASFYRARIASLRGRSADAVALVQETLTKGAWPYWIHLDPALHRLAARADYIALTKPRA